MTLAKSFAGALLGLMVFPAVHAGEKAVLVTPEELPPWSGSLSTGWDSLYMFRGVNQLPGPGGYGSSLSWTALSLTWSPTANDSFTVASWAAFGLGESDYKEIDGTLTYTRTLGDLSLSAGYALYAVLSAPGGLYSNELNVSAAYSLGLGPVTLTPGVRYDFTLGPEPENGGYIQSGAGYLEVRLDGEVAVCGDFLQAAGWVAAGFGFGYNFLEDSEQPFSGADHVEMGFALPIALGPRISVSPYVAYSHTWVQLIGTRRDTFWGGVAVEISF